MANPYGGQSHVIDDVQYLFDVTPLVSGGEDGLWYEATSANNNQNNNQRVAIRVHGQNMLVVRARAYQGDPRDHFQLSQATIDGVTYSLRWPLCAGGADGIAYLAAGSVPGQQPHSVVAIKLHLRKSDPLDTDNPHLVAHAKYDMHAR